MLHSRQAAEKVVELLNKKSTLLDIGSGLGEQAKFFEDSDLWVTCMDYVNNPKAVRRPDIVTDIENCNHRFRDFDCVWASHVLEHQKNVGRFLNICFTALKSGGILAITVPPFKHNIVGGHLTVWNPGLLLYNLVLAGFDCSNAKVLEYGYNISVIVKKPNFETIKNIFLLDLAYDNGDIEKIAPYMPEGCRTQSFNGDIKELNWNADI